MGALNRTELRSIEEQLTEYAVGYAGLLSWARGEVEAEEPEKDAEFPWRPAFLIFAGKGRVEVYQQVLEENRHAPDPMTSELVANTNKELDLWLNDCWNEVADLFEQAFPCLIREYHRSYLGATSGHTGWSFDDFLDERDLLEFFLIGVGDIFPASSFAAQLFEEDCQVRERIAELGLENFAEEFFPGRIRWYPARFWWHHRPEDRIPHPDSMET